MTEVPPNPPSGAPMLELLGVSKWYPGVIALDDVSMSIDSGEIVGLVGKNGAGKSTLIKALAGTVQPDRGEFRVDGKPVEISSARDAHANGFSFVHQELADIPDLTVAENLALVDRFPRRGGVFVNWRGLRRRAGEVLQRLAIDVDPSAYVGDLTIVQRRMVMIGAALYRDARLIVLDEPTASLTVPEIEQLHTVMRALRDQGVAIMYVSHRLDEIFHFCDRVVVMRDGRTVAGAEVKSIDGDQLLTWITGSRELAAVEHKRPTRSVVTETEVLRVENLGREGVVEGVSFTLNRGEVLGLAGLVGSGRSELVRLIIGADRPDEGTVYVRGDVAKHSSPAHALRHGVALLPEDRRSQAVIPEFGIRENITIASLRKFRLSRLLPMPRRAREGAEARKLMSDLDIQAPDEEKLVTQLSGGNQQKVILGRWLAHGADILIFDEPTQGIDVEVKDQIFRLIRSLVEAGKSVIFISSELQELERICDRVVVLREGRMVDEIEGNEITEERILASCYAPVEVPATHG